METFVRKKMLRFGRPAPLHPCAFALTARLAENHLRRRQTRTETAATPRNPRAQTGGSGTGLTINSQLSNSPVPPADMSAINNVQSPLALRPLNTSLHS